MDNNEQCNILLGVTGSVATVKTVQLAHKLSEFANVRLVFTQNAYHFLNITISDEFNEWMIDHKHECFSDTDEWNLYQKRGDCVLHIELRKWADIFLIAPLDANTLSKLANGMCDNLLTCIFRAWNWNSKNGKCVILAPAMNTLMWSNPFTDLHIQQLLKTFGKRNIHIISPIAKKLECKDIGMGAMENVNEIALYVHDIVLNRDMNDRQRDDICDKVQYACDIAAGHWIQILTLCFVIFLTLFACLNC